MVEDIVMATSGHNEDERLYHHSIMPDLRADRYELLFSQMRMHIWNSTLILRAAFSALRITRVQPRHKRLILCLSTSKGHTIVLQSLTAHGSCGLDAVSPSKWVSVGGQ